MRGGDESTPMVSSSAYNKVAILFPVEGGTENQSETLVAVR